jgi:hypothetical protein
VFELLANATVLVHLLFIAFIVFGGMLALLWPRIAWIHLPVALWGVVVQWMSWVCPLTPLENWFRVRGGSATYREGFVEHYVLPVLYPIGASPRLHVVLGLVVLVANAAIYATVLRRRARQRIAPSAR